MKRKTVKRKMMYCLMAAAFVTSCSGSSDTKTGENGENNAPLEIKPVTWENIIGQWTVFDEDLLTQKNLDGKIIEFVQDSIFYYDADGNSVHKFMEIDPTYGPKIETVKTGSMGNAKVSSPVSMNFHEMDPEKLMMTEEGKTIPMRQVK